MRLMPNSTCSRIRCGFRCSERRWTGLPCSLRNFITTGSLHGLNQVPANYLTREQQGENGRPIGTTKGRRTLLGVELDNLESCSGTAVVEGCSS